LFPDPVIDAIQRHVDAKRYLCATRPEYHDSLSEDSKRSLKLQGGIFSKQEAAAFIAEPGAKDAVQVRLWDDLAKQPALNTPGLSHYMQIARRCALKV
jgi:predicted HD phosphohydrolase